MKRHLTKEQLEFEQYVVQCLLSDESEQEKAYRQYNEIVGGDPVGLFIPNGYPRGVEEMGGPIKVYEECIRQGITWEKLLNYHEIPLGIVI